MLRRQRQIRAQIQKFLDAGLFALSLWIAHSLRTHFKFEVLGGPLDIEPFENYLWLFVIVVPVAPFLLEMQRFYDRPLLSSRGQTAWELFKACAMAVLVIISGMFLLKQPMSRSVIIFFGVISYLLVLLKEELVQMWVQTKYGQAQLKKRLILVGTPEDSARLMADLQRNSSAGVEILATLNLNESSTEELVQLLHSHSANGVVLSAKHTFFGQIEKAIQACELEGVEAWLLADFFNTQVSQTSLDDFNGRPMLVFRTTPEESWQKMAKQVMDVLVAFICLVLSSPILLAVAFLIRLTSPGPVLFRQERSGLNGRPFTMLKFRSMVSNAEQLKQELAQLNEMQGPVFKITNDPRVTRIGRFLRRTSLDEFPQLLNVLRGEMSLVGPRPLPVDEVERFDDLAHRRRLSVKPGLTCLWQVSGRSNVKDFRDWVRLDLEYIDNWSLWLDMKILARTVPVVLLGSGAK